jgi:DNA-binding LacI/PurR family transcriptional regulator
LGYSGPDPKGRLLRAGKFNAIGVATVEPLSFFFEDPFARILMTGITQASEASGTGVSLVSAASEEELAWNVRSALVDGFILFCLRGSDQLIASSRERQLPFVALALDKEDRSISAVGIDNIAGARDAARHLAELGHRRVAIVGMRFSEATHGRISMEQVKATAYLASHDRVIGYFEALREFGIDTSEVPIFETQSDPATIRAALEEIFAAPTPPTALLAQSDRIAVVALEWLKARDLSVPGDVSIVGFDGVPESETSIPPLTTVAQPIAEIGRRAAQSILDHDGTIRRQTLDVELVVRASTAPPRQG